MFNDRSPRYANNEDAITRLHDTVMMLNNEPVFLQANRGYEFIAFKMSGGAGAQGSTVNVKAISYEDLHATIPLGFMNVELKDPVRCDAYYLTRRPSRQTKEGLTRTNTDVARLGERTPPWQFGAPQMWETFHNTVVGNFPSVPDILKKLSKSTDHSSCAFDRQFAVYLKATDDEPQISIYWKTTMIGFVHITDTFDRGDPIRVTLLPAYFKNSMIIDTLRRHNFVL